MSIKVLPLFILLFLVGCAGAPVKTTPVTDLTAKETIASFSFLPPQDSGWLKAQFAQGWVNYMKKSEPDHTYSAWAKLIKLPSEVINDKKLLTLVKSMSNEGNDSSRFKVLSQNEEVDTSRKELCVKYHWLAEDHDAQKQSANVDYLMLDAYGLVCRHPYDKSVLIDFHYSERYKPVDDVKNLQSNANSYLNNIRFEGGDGGSGGIAIRDADLLIADHSRQISCNYHVLVEKSNDKWEITNIAENMLQRSSTAQEILCVNSGIDTVAPDWSSASGRQSGARGDCTLVDGIDHAVEDNLYNECNSVLASTSFGRSVLLNTLGFLASGSVGYSRVTDKELIRKISEEVGLVRQITEYKNKHKNTSD